MQTYIQKYMRTHLELTKDEAKQLNKEYYTQYGLAIQGLVNFHKINALDFNTEVDDALPLENILSEDKKLREMIVELKECGKVGRLWLFTNAYKNHGIRVVKLLGIEDLFDGMTYCDYSNETQFICKPDPRIFQRAMKEAGVEDPQLAYFVDDNWKNCQTAIDIGFKKVVHVNYGKKQESLKGCLEVETVLGIKNVLPELFKKD